jgi:regulator of sigma E protease
MDTLITALQFILALSILITLHEFGHYWAARAFGIRIEKFFLFFDAWNFKLFSFKKGDTEYGMGWLPLGGYVKISGMVDESLDTEQMKSEPQPWEFRSKPAWQRLIVMIGGVTVNLILGIIIMVALTYSQGEKYIPQQTVNEQGGIYAGPIAR